MNEAADTSVVEITPSAQQYLRALLDKQNDDGIGIRIFVTQPGTVQAETCIAYCRPDEAEPEDVRTDYPQFVAWFEARSIPFLEEALVDFAEDKFGGQLTIKAPNARMPKVSDDSPLEDRINYILYNEINPSLAAHGGEVSLVELTDDNYAVLQFGGGCQGCSAVDITLKNGVERSLLDQLPQLSGVRDVTDHTDRSQAYY